MISGPLDGTMSTYTYNQRNELMSVDNISASYDSEGRRTSITKGSQTTSFTVNPLSSYNQVLISEDDLGVKTYYVYGLGLISEEVNETKAYYHFDRRGSTIALTDSSEVITDTFEYDAYGEVLSHTGTSETPFRYVGQFGVSSDTDSLYFMMSRYYNVDIKRFINHDSLLGSISNALSTNQYAYLKGNPVNYVDPQGTRPVDPDGNTTSEMYPEIRIYKGTSKTYSSTYTYVDRYGNTVSKEWTVSDTEFLDSTSLTQQQITDIMNSKNEGLVERGFDVAVYEYVQGKGINPKVILATLAQEQGWCRNGNYNSAFGVGPGGNPIDFAEGEIGGLNTSVNTFIKWYEHGKSLLENGGLSPMHINYDPSPYPETRAVHGSNTEQWQADHPTDVEYMEQGQYVTPVNAAMYSKLKYTPWVDFPPQGSHPLDQWHSIFRSFDNY